MAAPPPPPAPRPPAAAPPTARPPPPPEAPPARPTAPAAPAPPPGEAPARRPPVNVAERYREIGTIRILALIFMFIAASMSILTSFVASGGFFVESVVGIGLTAGAIVCGFIAIINQRNRRLNNITTILAVSLMVAGAAARPVMLSVGEMAITEVEVIMSLLFAIFFLLFIEYTHGVRRFWEIGEMAIEKNLKDFDYGHVLRQYIVMGMVWLIVIVCITAGIVGLQMGMQAAFPVQFGKSAEMNSVYGLAIAEGVVFVLAAVGISLVRGRREYAQGLMAVAGPRPAPKPEVASSAQVFTPGKEPAPTGLSATAPPPRAK
ncbi:MAG: hypothetical protein QW379_00660 [Thermoplasmata archaeon]